MTVIVTFLTIAAAITASFASIEVVPKAVRPDNPESADKSGDAARKKNQDIPEQVAKGPHE